MFKCTHRQFAIFYFIALIIMVSAKILFIAYLKNPDEVKEDPYKINIIIDEYENEDFLYIYDPYRLTE